MSTTNREKPSSLPTPIRIAVEDAIQKVSDPGIYHEECFVRERLEYFQAIVAALDPLWPTTPNDGKDDGKELLIRKLIRVADIADLYLGPPCNNPAPVPGHRLVLEYQHGDDEVTITLDECRAIRAAKERSNKL